MQLLSLPWYFENKACLCYSESAKHQKGKSLVAKETTGSSMSCGSVGRQSHMWHHVSRDRWKIDCNFFNFNLIVIKPVQTNSCTAEVEYAAFMDKGHHISRDRGIGECNFFMTQCQSNLLKQTHADTSELGCHLRQLTWGLISCDHGKT